MTLELERLGEDLVETSGPTMIQVQRRQKRKKQQGTNNNKRDSVAVTTTELYDMTFYDAIGCCIYDSNHTDSYYVFCEDGLKNVSDESINKAILQKPFSSDEQNNWFDYFPIEYKPTDAIIIAGTGAASTLHRDPFEWTGLNVCMEGTKIWRFIVPNNNDDDDDDDDDDDSFVIGEIDKALQSYRLNSIAWEDDDSDDSDNKHNKNTPLSISAGWQSDLNLFESVDTTRFPDSYQWYQIRDIGVDGFDKFNTKMEQLACDTTCLCPSDKTMDAIKRMSSQVTCMTAIQHPGDLLIIPAHCWHMTYAPIPSLAIASQRCSSSKDGRRVLDHILSQMTSQFDISFLSENIPHILTKEHYNNDDDEKTVVDELFQFISRLQQHYQSKTQSTTT